MVKKIKTLCLSLRLSFTLAPRPPALALQPHLVILLSQALPKAHKQTQPPLQSLKRYRLQLQHRSIRQMKQAKKRELNVQLQPPLHLPHPQSHPLPHLVVFPSPLVRTEKRWSHPSLRGHQAGRTADRRPQTEWRV